MALRVWAGLKQAVERRVGEPLDLEAVTTIPMDWRQAEQRLKEAINQVWSRRTERLVDEIGRELEVALRRDGVDEALIIRLLVRMSYGQKAYFDPKTHRRQSVAIARLSYTYSAARLLDVVDSTTLTDRVLAHLEGAQHVLQMGLGRVEAARLAGSRLDQLDQRSQRALKLALGEEAFAESNTVGALNMLPDATREQINRALGEMALSRIYRGLILSVGDRLWVDYLTRMEALRTSIGLEAYGQRDPLVQYKSRAFDMFGQLLAGIRAGVVSQMFTMRVTGRPQAPPASQPRQPRAQVRGDGKTATMKKKRRKKRKRRR
ncbi:MAG: hypothetical protein E3J37_06925 [Anaerolineales bacterium]|nr:MAG: hypothetical protein E3J37_06925 [Anaerolineales bacterium]